MNGLLFRPIVSLEEVTQETANRLLERWGHKIGPVARPYSKPWCHALHVGDEPVAVTTSHTLIRDQVGGGLAWLNRGTAVELSRLCAGHDWACRVMLRLWRECVFPALGYRFAVSYQDAQLHTGNTYRFDGWLRAGYSRAGGNDTRSGREARDKFVWVWPAAAARAQLAVDEKAPQA